MASDFQKPDRVHTLFPDEIPEKMWPLPIRNLLFLGKASEQKLLNQGIRTIGDLAREREEMYSSGLEKNQSTDEK